MITFVQTEGELDIYLPWLAGYFTKPKHREKERERERERDIERERESMSESVCVSCAQTTMGKGREDGNLCSRSGKWHSSMKILFETSQKVEDGFSVPVGLWRLACQKWNALPEAASSVSLQSIFCCCRRLKFMQYRTGVWKCHRSLSPDPSPSTG